MAAFSHFVVPIAREFNPDLIFVSAGFDAAPGDIGGCKVNDVIVSLAHVSFNACCCICA
jgi:histone deacetylase 6